VVVVFHPTAGLDVDLYIADPFGGANLEACMEEVWAGVCVLLAGMEDLQGFALRGA
jgi:hypothetical protein